MVSGAIGGFGGMVLAGIILFSLFEITTTIAFSIIFGIGFLILGLALGWRIFKTIEGNLKKSVLMLLAMMVFASGICSFFINKTWFPDIQNGGRAVMTGLVGLSFSFSVTFIFTELLSIGPCERCCNQSNPIFSSPKQIFGLFVVGLILGVVSGVIFGVTYSSELDGKMNIEDDAVISLPLAVVAGFLYGCFNQWWRMREAYQKIEEQKKYQSQQDSKF
uniref:Uncharacterized protein n=1 Tax=Arcella intermedia TaxID=1963864 RepID=A0A6B2LHD4_9EUKA